MSDLDVTLVGLSSSSAPPAGIVTSLINLALVQSTAFVRAVDVFLAKLTLVSGHRFVANSAVLSYFSHDTILS